MDSISPLTAIASIITSSHFLILFLVNRRVYLAKLFTTRNLSETITDALIIILLVTLITAFQSAPLC